MGEAGKDALRVGFDHAIKLEFHGEQVSSDAGLFPYRDLITKLYICDARSLEQD